MAGLGECCFPSVVGMSLTEIKEQLQCFAEMMPMKWKSQMVNREEREESSKSDPHGGRCGLNRREGGGEGVD